MNTFVSWETERLLVRPYGPADARSLLEAVQESLDTVGRWLPWCHPGYAIEDAQAWIAQCGLSIDTGSGFDLGVFCKASGALLGSVAINQIRRSEGIGDIGYWLRQSAQGRGLASEALSGLPALGFEALALSRLEIVVAVGNLPSRRLAERSGAHFEGIAANRLRIAEAPVDAWIYALTPART